MLFLCVYYWLIYYYSCFYYLCGQLVTIIEWACDLNPYEDKDDLCNIILGSLIFILYRSGGSFEAIFYFGGAGWLGGAKTPVCLRTIIKNVTNYNTFFFKNYIYGAYISSSKYADFFYRCFIISLLYLVKDPVIEYS